MIDFRMCIVVFHYRNIDAIFRLLDASGCKWGTGESLLRKNDVITAEDGDTCISIRIDDRSKCSYLVRYTLEDAADAMTKYCYGPPKHVYFEDELLFNKKLSIEQNKLFELIDSKVSPDF